MIEMNIYQKKLLPISVVMPVYNVESYIKEAMDSILNQTFTDFEFIIIDDGSTDTTWDIIQSYKDSRIVPVRNETNLGNYPSRNKGMKMAKGKYIAVMDGDDIAMPERLEKQYNYLENTPDTIALGSDYMINSERKVANVPLRYENICFSLLSAFRILHPSLMVRTEIMNSLGGYKEEYKYAADYKLFCILSLMGKIENLPDVLMFYRLHEKQISKDRKAEQDQYAKNIRKDYQVSFINKYKQENQDYIEAAEVGIPEIGLSICHYTYAKFSNKEKYKEIANKTIDALYKIVTKDTPVCIDNGLCGLGCGLHYLIRNKFLDGDIDEVLEDIDNKTITTIKEEGSNLKYKEDIVYYLSYRVSKATNPDSQRIQYLNSVYATLPLILENHE